jgi:hypothetical protein
MDKARAAGRHVSVARSSEFCSNPIKGPGALTKGQARQARAGSARMAAVSSSTATRTGP